MWVASTTFGLLMLPDAFTLAARLPESGCPAKPEAAASRGSSRSRSAASLSSPASCRLPLPVRSIAAPLKASVETCTDLPVSKDACASSRGSRPRSSAAPGGRPCKAAVRSARTASIVPAPSPIVTSDPRSILPSIGGREVGSGIAAATSGRSAGTSRSSRSRPATRSGSNWPPRLACAPSACRRAFWMSIGPSAGAMAARSSVKSVPCAPSGASGLPPWLTPATLALPVKVAPGNVVSNGARSFICSATASCCTP